MNRYIIFSVITALLLFLLSWVTPFCDLYAAPAYGVISDVLGFITGILPVNIGECLMYLAVPLLAGCVILPFLLIFLHKKEKYKSFTIRYLKFMLCTLITLLLIYELNWWLPLRSRLMGGTIVPVEEFGIDEIEAVRSDLVEKINALSEVCPRDEEGHLIYVDEETMRRAVSDAMHRNADIYGRLSGYYPRIKAAYCSDVLDWMGIGGYTYPYTMELTYNKYVTSLYCPALFSHESAHHQGYYRENEANFIEFLTAEKCEEPRIRYAIYLDMYRYINYDYITALYQTDPDTAKDRYKEQPKLSELVWQDEEEAFYEAEERYEADAHPLESASETATEVSETGWETQGELLGADGYDGVVLLILQYYRQQ